MELLIVCVPVCVSRAVIQFLMAKNTAVEIHRQLTKAYDSDVMRVQMERKWCRDFHEAKCTGCPKVVMDESVNTICTLLNKDCRLTLQELEMIMNDDLGNPLSQMSISRIMTNLGTQFYQASMQKLVSRNDKCLNLFWRLCGKIMYSKGIK